MNTTEPNRPRDANTPWLIFTDLDGTLLDHHHYGFAPAVPTLRRLRQAQHTLILATSKTCAEVLPLREQLGNNAPFIVENGAGIYLPLDFLPEAQLKNLSGLSPHQGYWRLALTHPRAYWQALLAQAGFAKRFATFADLGTEGISQFTGLSKRDAEAANQREFSEPVMWLGNDADKQAFIERMQKLGANVLQGGRFLHITGDADKGRALRWLADCYQTRDQQPYRTLAAGDGKNDIPMLEIADAALVMQSPVNPTLTLARQQGVTISPQPGPAGWAAGIESILNRGEHHG